MLAPVPDVVLPWENYGAIRWVMDGPPSDGWSITAFVDGRAPAGLAVQLSGRFAIESHDLLAATMTRTRRYHRWWSTGRLTGHAIPVVPDALFASCTKERATVRALMNVLVSRPELRGRLTNGERRRHLATELTTRPLSIVYERSEASRDRLDIVHAMHQAGFVHRFNRPLPDDDLAPLTEVRVVAIRRSGLVRSASVLAAIFTCPQRRDPPRIRRSRSA